MLVIVELREVRQAWCPGPQHKVHVLGRHRVALVVRFAFLPGRRLVAQQGEPQFLAGVVGVLELGRVGQAFAQVLQLVAGERAHTLSHFHRVDDLGFLERLEAEGHSTGTNLAHVEAPDVLADHHVRLVQQGTEPRHQLAVIPNVLGLALVFVEHALVAQPLGRCADDCPVLGNLGDADVLIPRTPQAVSTDAD